MQSNVRNEKEDMNFRVTDIGENKREEIINSMTKL